MLKKILLIALVTSVSQADIKLEVRNSNVYLSTTENPYTYIIKKTSKDWIAVYPKGSSTAFKNVKYWKWVKDLPCSIPDECNDDFFLPLSLDKGEYEIRYLKNNSYVTSASVPYSVKQKNTINLAGLNASYTPSYRSLTLDTNPFRHYTDKFKPNPKDWVGIYNVNDSSSWHNVKAWAWVKNFNVDNDSSYKWKNLNLPTGKYEVRYFLNNSYTTFKTSNSFEVKRAVNNNKLLKLFVDYQKQNKKGYFYLYGDGQVVEPNPKDWVGIYKEDSSTEWKNVVAWVWAKEFKKDYKRSQNKYTWENLNLPKGKYEFRYFLNNSYKTFKKFKFEVLY